MLIMNALTPTQCHLRRFFIAISLFSLSLALPFIASAAERNATNPIMPEADFIGEPGQAPRGWEVPHPNYLERIHALIVLRENPDGAGNIVHFETADSGKTVAMQSALEIRPEWVGRTLRISAEMRTDGLQVGSESWHNARVILSMKNTEGKVSYPSALSMTVSDIEWNFKSTSVLIEEDHQVLEFNVGLFNSKGVLQIRNFEVVLD
jgi:hypothetical protein